jgi:N-acetylmuramoyl-L-alanine amidase
MIEKNQELKVQQGLPQVAPIPTRKTSIFGNLQAVFAVSILMATLFTMWNPANLFSNQLLNQAFQSFVSNPVSAPVVEQGTPQAVFTRIGIIAGHYSDDPTKYDPGTVCSDGLTEEKVNYSIAYLVYQKLTSLGYQVDLLQEFDPKLMGYQAAALVSIHNDSCQYINENATGYKVASAIASASPENDSRLTSCLIDRYGKDTGLQLNSNTITPDMQMYHAFYSVNSQTPAAIIETGFLNLDRTFLTEHTDTVAQGVVDGILCYLRNESIDSTTPTP